MPLEAFQGLRISSLLAQAQRMVGEDAVVLSVRRIPGEPMGNRREAFELVAAHELGPLHLHAMHVLPIDHFMHFRRQPIAGTEKAALQQVTSQAGNNQDLQESRSVFNKLANKSFHVHQYRSICARFRRPATGG